MTRKRGETLAKLAEQDPSDIPHAKSVDELLQARAIDRDSGLSWKTVPLLQQKYGYNELDEVPGEAWWRKFLRQFKSLVIAILILAAILSGVMGDWLETWAILTIVLLNGLMGFIQEARAERALASLRRLSSPQAKVIRQGILHSLPAKDLVPSDIIIIEAGDYVPADSRLLESFSVKAQEASLTGESTSVEKQAKSILPRDTDLADRSNMVYLGTQILSGKATALVTSIGMQTEMGRIAGMLKQQESEPTPLQRRLSELGHILLYICLGIVLLILLLEWLRGGSLSEIFLFAISLAVAAVPEGLPAVVTIALALGLTRMSKQNALIRKLPSVETLGSVTVICSDKTGTLTRNEMTVERILAGQHSYRVTGSGYAPQGEFLKLEAGIPPVPVDARQEVDLNLALHIGARCNHAALTPPKDSKSSWTIVGDPTEAALLVAAQKAGFDLNSQGPLLYEIPFDSDRKLMSVFVRDAQGKPLMYSKGAPESILTRCTHEQVEGRQVPLDEKRRQDILKISQDMAADALRILGLAYKPLPQHDFEQQGEESLIFVGLAGMIDPPRDEVKDTVRLCQKAGIRPVMITGDHPITAKAIAKELGILTDAHRVVSGRELDQLSDSSLAQTVKDIAVYARVSPEHKLRVVKAWKTHGDIIAMTGDGVNDAPAVKAADIGIAMGITGTDVTKDAAAMILTDDNFSSIVHAVEEGRGIFDNIRNIIHFLLSGNTSEILLVFVSILMGWPTPLTAIQILWINLITDGFPALALATERPGRDVMSRPPRSSQEHIFNWRGGRKILQHGAFLALVMIIGFWWALHENPETKGSIPQAQAIAFCICAFAQLGFSFACRSRRYTLPELGLFSNTPLLLAFLVSMLLQMLIIFTAAGQSIFFAEAPRWGHMTWIAIGTLSLLPVSCIEITKIIRKAVSHAKSSSAAS